MRVAGARAGRDHVERARRQPQGIKRERKADLEQTREWRCRAELLALMLCADLEQQQHDSGVAGKKIACPSVRASQAC